MRVLIVGIDSFTGQHLKQHLEVQGNEIFGTTRISCDISNESDVKKVIKDFQPEGIVHLAGISFVGHENTLDFYRVNVLGAENILKAARGTLVKKILLASSSVVYGNQAVPVYDESLVPHPVNHYGISKYAMEQMAKMYMNDLPIVITRPFNYTGVGQSEQFLIPKIVAHYAQGKAEIELGNLNVQRELNDVSYVCEAYTRLLNSNVHSDVVNISSGRATYLIEAIEHMNKIAGYEIRVTVNPKFVRSNEIPILKGSPDKLMRLIGVVEQCGFEQTLRTMYDSAVNMVS
jgi:nucleoside-diphosphate-sugar epimerase